MRVFARAGDQAAGAPSGVAYSGFLWSPVYNHNTAVAFKGQLAGVGIDLTNDTGVWTGSQGALRLIARAGDTAPGAADDARFARFDHFSNGDTVISGSLMSMNAENQVAFMADLVGDGITSTNNTGIWATDRSGLLRLIAREGEQLEIAPGIVKTIYQLDFGQPTNNEDGHPSSFNDLGQVAFHAIFTDLTEGIFVSDIATVPEPSSMGLSILALIAVLFAQQLTTNAQCRPKASSP
jgi:hypothetical protein